MKAGEIAFLGLVGVGLFVCSVLWLWGGLAGLLWGEGWPTGVSLTDQLDVVKRLPDNLSDPARAWPVEARAALPSDALPFYATLALVLPASSGALTLVGLVVMGLKKLA